MIFYKLLNNVSFFHFRTQKWKSEHKIIKSEHKIMKSEHIISDKTFHNCLEIFPKYSGIFLDILSTFHCSFPSFFAHVGKPRSPQPFLSAALVACSGLAASMSSSTSSSSSSSEPEAPKASGPVAVSAGLGVASGPRSTASSSAEGLRVCHTLRKARCCLLCSAQSSAGLLLRGFKKIRPHSSKVPLPKGPLGHPKKTNVAPNQGSFWQWNGHQFVYL